MLRMCGSVSDLCMLIILRSHVLGESIDQNCVISSQLFASVTRNCEQLSHAEKFAPTSLCYLLFPSAEGKNYFFESQFVPTSVACRSVIRTAKDLHRVTNNIQGEVMRLSIRAPPRTAVPQGCISQPCMGVIYLRLS